MQREVPESVAVLWGGGLGDVLVIRPLLQRMNEVWGVRPHYLSRVIHFPQLFSTFGLDVAQQQLPAPLPELIRDMRSIRGSFEGVYIGGRATLKTRLLGHVIATDSFWHSSHDDRSPFIQEQVLADCQMLGLGEYSIDELVEDTKAWSHSMAGSRAVDGEYFVLHPSSKGGWETKNWPDSHWRALVGRLLDELGQSVCLVGTRQEEPRLQRLVQRIGRADRVRVLTALSMRDLFGLVEQSAGVICHNSGLLHVAVQLGKKTLCLNGSSALHWRASYPWVENIDSGRCQLRCNRYRCPVPGFDARCIKEISVAQVLSRVGSFLLAGR